MNEMKRNSQQGIALIWVIITGALLVTSIGVLTSRKKPSEIGQPPAKVAPTQRPTLQPSPSPQGPPPDFDPLKGLKNAPMDFPSIQDMQEQIAKAKAEMKKNLSKYSKSSKPNVSAPQINPQVPDFSNILDSDKMFKGLDEINKKAREQIQTQPKDFTPPEIDYDKLDQYLKENPQYPPGEKPKSPREQGIEEFEEKTGVDLDAPK